MFFVPFMLFNVHINMYEWRCVYACTCERDRDCKERDRERALFYMGPGALGETEDHLPLKILSLLGFYPVLYM